MMKLRGETQRQHVETAMLHFMRFFGDRNEGDDEDRSLCIHEKAYGLWSEIETIRVLLEEYDET